MGWGSGSEVVIFRKNSSLCGVDDFLADGITSLCCIFLSPFVVICPSCSFGDCSCFSSSSSFLTICAHAVALFLFSFSTHFVHNPLSLTCASFLQPLHIDIPILLSIFHHTNYSYTSSACGGFTEISMPELATALNLFFLSRIVPPFFSSTSLLFCLCLTLSRY